MSNEPRGVEHRLFLMNLEVTLFISTEPRGMEHCLFFTEPRGMEHCLFLMNLEVWNIVYFYRT